MGHLTTLKSSFKFHTNSDDQRQTELDSLDKPLSLTAAVSNCKTTYTHKKTKAIQWDGRTESTFKKHNLYVTDLCGSAMLYLSKQYLRSPS